MIKHSSKVKVDDLQGLILVTSVVASATDKSEELSEESQVNNRWDFIEHSPEGLFGDQYLLNEGTYLVS